MNPLATAAAIVAGMLLGACTSLEPAASAGGPEGTLCTALGHLARGQVCVVDVRASRIQVDSGLRLKTGEVFRFSVAPGQRWNDWGRDAVDPVDGDPGNRLMNWFRALRRMPDAPWMTLGIALPGCAVHSAGSSTPPGCSGDVHRLGKDGLELAIPHPGELVFFANDVPLMNWNNRGSVRVRVERLR